MFRARKRLQQRRPAARGAGRRGDIGLAACVGLFPGILLHEGSHGVLQGFGTEERRLAVAKH